MGAFEDHRQRDASSPATQAHRDSVERRKITGFGTEDMGEILPLPPMSREALGKALGLESQSLTPCRRRHHETHLTGLLRGLSEVTRAKLPEQFPAHSREAKESSFVPFSPLRKGRLARRTSRKPEWHGGAGTGNQEVLGFP